MTTVIRKANINDSSLILNFIYQLADYEKLSHEVSATQEMLKENLFGDKQIAYCLIAEYENKSVGFALYFYNFSTFLGKPGLYLEDLYIQPEYRNYGIGKALLKKLIEIAIEENLGRIEWSVLKWNTPSIEFYKRLGAETMDQWASYRLTSDKFSGLEKW